MTKKIKTTEKMSLKGLFSHFLRECGKIIEDGWEMKHSAKCGMKLCIFCRVKTKLIVCQSRRQTVFAANALLHHKSVYSM